MYINLGFEFTKLISFHIFPAWGSTQIQMQPIYDVWWQPQMQHCLCMVAPCPSHLQEEDEAHCSGYQWSSAITSVWLSKLLCFLLQTQDLWCCPGEWYYYVCLKIYLIIFSMNVLRFTACKWRWHHQPSSTATWNSNKSMTRSFPHFSSDMYLHLQTTVALKYILKNVYFSVISVGLTRRYLRDF